MNENQAGVSTYLTIFVVLIIATIVFFAVRNNGSEQIEQEQENTNTNTQHQSMSPAEAPMMEENNSNQEGKVTLTEVDGKTKVVIEIAPGPRGVSQPAHINLGDCNTVGSLKYNLNPVVDGISETTLQPALHFIHGLGQLTVNVRKSDTEDTSLVSCGPITSALDAVMNMDLSSMRGDLQTEGTLDVQ